MAPEGTKSLRDCGSPLERPLRTGQQDNDSCGLLPSDGPDTGRVAVPANATNNSRLPSPTPVRATHQTYQGRFRGEKIL